MPLLKIEMRLQFFASDRFPIEPHAGTNKRTSFFELQKEKSPILIPMLLGMPMKMLIQNRKSEGLRITQTRPVLFFFD